MSKPSSPDTQPPDPASAGDRPSIAYLTSVYPRATDTFVRAEIAALEELGFDIHRFGVRRPDASQLVSAAVEDEAKRTTYLLGRDRLLALMLAAVAAALGSPVRTIRAVPLTFSTGGRGLVARIRQVVYLFEAMLLARELRRRRVDHLHNHISENSAHVAMLASRLTGIPFSTTVHGMELLSAAELGLGEKIERSAFTVCISGFTRSQCMMHLSRSTWAKLVVVRCGVGAEFLEAAAAPFPERHRFVCVGRLSPEKGHLQLVEAARLLVEAGLDFELVIVGDGELRPELENLIASSGLNERVRITGWLDSGDVRRAIGSSSVLVVPSFSEGIPVAIMEALALGRPVVSSRVGGIPELVEHGKSGWLVTPGSVESLVAAMTAAIQAGPEELAEKGGNGAERVRQLHDVTVEAAKLAARFRAVIAGQALSSGKGPTVRA